MQERLAAVAPLPEAEQDAARQKVNEEAPLCGCSCVLVELWLLFLPYSYKTGERCVLRRDRPREEIRCLRRDPHEASKESGGDARRAPGGGA